MTRLVCSCARFVHAPLVGFHLSFISWFHLFPYHCWFPFVSSWLISFCHPLVSSSCYHIARLFVPHHPWFPHLTLDGFLVVIYLLYVFLSPPCWAHRVLQLLVSPCQSSYVGVFLFASYLFPIVSSLFVSPRHPIVVSFWSNIVDLMFALFVNTNV